MEKKKRHYPLELVKQLVFEGNWRASGAALSNAWRDFDYVRDDLREIILQLNPQEFYKSMTSYQDCRIWQDVYRPILKGVMVYMKLSIVDQRTLLVQFKRK